MNHEYIDFRISRRTLRVGMQAFPLRGITRVRPIEIKPNRKRAVLTFGRRAGATAGLGFVGLVVLACLGDAVPPVATVLLVAAALLVLAGHTVTLIKALNRSPLYILSVATAGTARAALVSEDRGLIYNLTDRVVDAIDNPPNDEYKITVENLALSYGDIVHGSKYGGDHIEGDKIEGWS